MFDLVYVDEPVVRPIISTTGFKEYFVEVQNSVRDYSEAVEKCAQINATLAKVNSQAIRDFLVNVSGNLSGGLQIF